MPIVKLPSHFFLAIKMQTINQADILKKKIEDWTDFEKVMDACSKYDIRSCFL